MSPSSENGPNKDTARYANLDSTGSSQGSIKLKISAPQKSIHMAVHLSDVACGIPIVDPHIAAIDPAEFLQSLIERIDVRLHLWIVLGEADDCADTSYLIVLLRARRNGPS